MANWMGGVAKTMHHGALRATAKRMGILKSDSDKLTLADVRRLKKSKDPVTRRRATLAETFMSSRH